MARINIEELVEELDENFARALKAVVTQPDNLHHEDRTGPMQTQGNGVQNTLPEAMREQQA